MHDSKMMSDALIIAQVKGESTFVGNFENHTSIQSNSPTNYTDGFNSISLDQLSAYTNDVSKQVLSSNENTNDSEPIRTLDSRSKLKSTLHEIDRLKDENRKAIFPDSVRNFENLLANHEQSRSDFQDFTVDQIGSHSDHKNAQANQIESHGDHTIIVRVVSIFCIVLALVCLTNLIMVCLQLCTPVSMRTQTLIPPHVVSCIQHVLQNSFGNKQDSNIESGKTLDDVFQNSIENENKSNQVDKNNDSDKDKSNRLDKSIQTIVDQIGCCMGYEQGCQRSLSNYMLLEAS
jgi:hypothetical protein